jgi:cell division septum initiation protein DivIVA
MTQVEMTKFLDQINQAFKDQFDKLELLQLKLDQLEAKVNEQERSKTSKSGSKRVQQAKADA